MEQLLKELLEQVTAIRVLLEQQQGQVTIPPPAVEGVMADDLQLLVALGARR